MANPPHESLAKISFSSYWRQLNPMLPSPTGMVVCDSCGDLVWSNDDLPEEARNSTTRILGHLLAETSSAQARDVNHVLENGHEVHAVPLCSSAGDIVGLIGVVNAASGNGAADRVADLERALRGIAENVAREGKLIGELDAMAAELALRYEELNLLYNIADESEVEQSECKQALGELVRICGAHLESSLAAVILPEQGIIDYQTFGPQENDDTEHLVQVLKREVCPWVMTNCRQLVLNGPDEPLRATACPGLEGKLMVCPVLNELGAAYGIIAVIRAKNDPDFTTGDRRLLEVVDTKASKVLQLSYDALTGLMNRNEFIRSLDRSLATAHSHGSHYCLLVIEVDHLRVVNDAFGHEAGDALLTYVTRTLRERLRDKKHALARVGGANFALLIPGCSADAGQQIARSLAQTISATPFAWRDSRRNINVSVGIATMDRHTQRATAILYAAEIACDVASGFSIDRVAIYDKTNSIFLEKREDMRWVGMMQTALVEDQFLIYCQPIEAADSTDNGATHHEILLRLRDEPDSILTPAHFMPAAERFYLMPDIDRWVVRRVFAYLSELEGTLPKDDYLWSINLSGQSLSDDGFLDFVLDQLNKHAIPPQSICFEVTETAAVTNLERAQRLIRALRGFGCRFSLDDFGAGLSSFAYLKSLRVDHLKIDGSFVLDVLHNKISEAVVSSIIHLGHVLQIEVIAEWVEDVSTRRLLGKLGVDFVQGFGVAKPFPIDEWIRGRGENR